MDTISVKSFGVTDFCGQQARENIRRNVVKKSHAAGLDGFYHLDFLCFDLCLNRQWPGANGAFDHKTPLTVYPYALNGFNQRIESKLHSYFVRDVVGSFLPAWKEAPFFHELKSDEIEDFYIAYPTCWEMGRGEELLEMCSSKSCAWNLFERNTLLATFKNMLDVTYTHSLSTRKISNINTTAQKLIWVMTLERNLQQLNRAMPKG
ncbi:hypothetical protein [Desulfovibrio sp. ZJ200]|uniref:hypothetical protein n=1 Tax=Desulfovibrio sp. ZJ200 TaxID=2709792 RepID=UPI00197DA8AF|nr:hypothetical protein [Desulfovibrio sp. ZJ200]